MNIGFSILMCKHLYGLKWELFQRFWKFKLVNWVMLTLLVGIGNIYESKKPHGELANDNTNSNASDRDGR